MSKMHLVSTHTLPQMCSQEQYANQTSTLQTPQNSEYVLNHVRFSSHSRLILKVVLFVGKERECKDNCNPGFANTGKVNSCVQTPELLLQLPVCVQVT